MNTLNTMNITINDFSYGNDEMDIDFDIKGDGKIGRAHVWTPVTL